MIGRHAIEMLDSAAGRRPGDAYLRGAATLTVGEVAAGSHAVAAWLRQQGTQAGDRVLIIADNHPEAIVAAFGAARCGATFAFIHRSIRPYGLERLLDQTEPAAVVLDASTLGLRDLMDGLPLLTIGDVDVDGGTPMSSVLATRHDAGEAVKTDPLCLVFTSGSTGVPRGVMISHDNLMFSSNAIQARLGYRADDVVGLFLPLSFDYGWYQVPLALAAGASLYVAPLDSVPLALVDSLLRERITVLPGVPTLLSVLVKMLDREPTALQHLRSVTNTGERLPPETMARLWERCPGLDIFPMYGLTECKRVSILLPSELAVRPDSVGRPLDGTTVEVVDGDGAPQAAGAPGELVVSGPHLTMGYWRAPEETRQRFETAADGTRRLHTGDTCRLDEGGYVYFEGRNDAQIKRDGFRISLFEIEEAATAVPGVTAAAAANHERLELYVTGRNGVTADSVLRVLRDRLESHKVPDAINVVSSLPVTPNGKVDRSLLRLPAEEAQ